MCYDLAHGLPSEDKWDMPGFGTGNLMQDKELLYRCPSPKCAAEFELTTVCSAGSYFDTLGNLKGISCTWALASFDIEFRKVTAEFIIIFRVFPAYLISDIFSDK